MIFFLKAWYYKLESILIFYGVYTLILDILYNIEIIFICLTSKKKVGH